MDCEAILKQWAVGGAGARCAHAQLRQCAAAKKRSADLPGWSWHTHLPKHQAAPPQPCPAGQRVTAAPFPSVITGQGVWALLAPAFRHVLSRL